MAYQTDSNQTNPTRTRVKGPHGSDRRRRRPNGARARSADPLGRPTPPWAHSRPTASRSFPPTSRVHPSWRLLKAVHLRVGRPPPPSADQGPLRNRLQEPPTDL